MIDLINDGVGTNRGQHYLKFRVFHVAYLHRCHLYS